MKKALVGCLLVMVVFVVVGAAGVYFGLVRPGQALIERAQTIANYESELTTASAFEAPDDGRLTEEMVTRYVEVRRAIASAAEAPAAQLAPALRGDQNIENFSEFVAWLGDAKDAVEAAYALRTAQIAAMNAAQMSRAEFEWIGSRFFAVVAPGIDPQRLQQLLEQGAPVDWDAVGGAEGGEDSGEVIVQDAPADPEATDNATVANARLVEPYREEAQAWVQLFAMGF